MKKIITAFIFIILTVVFIGIARADSYSTDFESPVFSLGSVNGQDGWRAQWPNQEIVGQSLYPAFSNQSFRMSNAGNVSYASVFSKPLVNPAGSPTANNGTFPLGIRQPSFEAEWDFASVTQASQPGLQVDVTLIRGDEDITRNIDGMSRIMLSDSTNGIKVQVAGFDSTLPYGGDVVFKTVADGLDRTLAHHVKVTVDFSETATPGARDVVMVCVDRDAAKCAQTDTLRDVYLPYGAGFPTVRMLGFFPVVSGADVNIVKGFYFDNLLMSSSGNEPVPTVAPTGGPAPEPSLSPTPSVVLVSPPKKIKECKKYGWKKFNNPAFINQGQCIKYVLKNLWKDLKNQDESKWDKLDDKYEDD